MIKIEFSGEINQVNEEIKNYVEQLKKEETVPFGAPMSVFESKEIPTFVEPINKKQILSESIGHVPSVSNEPVPAAQVDKHGVVYDPTKHSSSMTLNKDGSWKAKKVFNTQPVKTAEVKPAAPIAVLPEVEPVPPVIPGAIEMTYNYFKLNFFLIINQLVSENKITREYISQLEDYFKIKNIWNVLGNENQCIGLFNTLRDAGLIKEVGSETNN